MVSIRCACQEARRKANCEYTIDSTTGKWCDELLFCIFIVSIGCQESLLLAQLCPSRQVAVRRAATMCQHGFEMSLPFAADTELSILAMRALLSIEPLVSLCLVCAW